MYVPPGTRIDRYEVERPLGAGGMGQIYLARDLKLERRVAVKLLSRELVTDERLVGRFRREAQALVSLNHPHLLTVFDVGEIGGTPYFVTELVEGSTLRELIDERDLPLGETLRIVAQAAAGLAAAHAQGIVHRDVKPENLMVRRDGYVKVLDFGVAKLLEEGGLGVAAQVTATATLVGTVRYMSPEQLRGEEVDPRTDVWGLGAVLYELLTDTLPFPGRTPSDVIAAVLRAPFVPASQVAPARAPRALDVVLGRALAKERERRYSGCGELAAELETLRSALRTAERGGSTEILASPGGGTPSATASGSWSSATASGPWREISAALHDAAAQGAPRHNLPPPATSFFGRGEELAALLAALRRPEVRLLVISGPGGSGKTRLGLEVAARLVEDFPDGVWQVPLSAVGDPAAVPQAIAAALGVVELGEQPTLEGLAAWLRGRRLLLLLDNFEQVVAAAPALAALLAAGPGLKLLVTSREVLRLQGEHDFPLPPLAVPEGDRSNPLELAAVPAVALFVDRAAALLPGFQLDEGNAAAVRELCRRLDGLPLAIELAAARVRVLSPAAMLRRLDDRFRLLAGGPADLPGRHRTLRGTLDWGHELLSERERELFRRASVFRGSFTLAAVEAVCADPEDAPAMLDLLHSLVDKSLVVRRDAVSEGREAAGEPRFVQLETIREYAAGLLAEEERAEARRRHAAFFLDLAERGVPELAPPGQRVSIEELALAADDLRAALEWALEQADPEPALRLTGALWWFWYLHGDYGEGRRWTAAALARGGGDSVARSRTLLGAGALAMWQCDYAAAEELLERARELGTTLGEQRVVAGALQLAGSVARERGLYERALALHGESLRRWQELGDPRGVARSLNYLAFVSWLHGDRLEAARLAEEAHDRFRALDDHEGVVWALLNRTAVACYGGDLHRARSLGRETFALASAGGYKEGIAWSLDLLGTVALREGRPERAVALLQRSLALHRELGDRWRMASVLEGLAAVARATGELPRSARLEGAAGRLREQLGTPVPPAERADRERDREAARQVLGPESWQAAEREGRELGLERAVAYALSREASVEVALEGAGGSLGGLA